VVAEVALAMALLVGAGTLFRAFWEIQYGDQGFRTEGLLSFGLALPGDKYPDDERRFAFQERLLEELGAVPGVAAVASTTALPRSRAMPVGAVELEGVELGEEAAPEVSWLAVSPSYFEALGLPVLRGRGLEAADRAGGMEVAVVDAAFVDRFFEGGEAIGRRFAIEGRSRTVVGVVPNVKQRRISGLDSVSATVYLPAAQVAPAQVQFLMRARSGPAEQLADGARAAVWEIDPELPLDSVMSLDDFVGMQLAGIDVLTGVVGGFAGFAMLLAALGVYGLLAYSVTQRTQEIGVRMAMGASRRRVMGMVLRQGVALVGVGLLFGAPMAWGVTRLMPAILGPTAAPPASFVPAITLGLVLVTLAASLLPARRAATLPPLVALRAE
jgi:predicted permease